MLSVLFSNLHTHFIAYYKAKLLDTQSYKTISAIVVCYFYCIETPSPVESDKL